jgi:hypothetical protein
MTSTDRDTCGLRLSDLPFSLVAETFAFLTVTEQSGLRASCSCNVNAFSSSVENEQVRDAAKLELDGHWFPVVLGPKVGQPRERWQKYWHKYWVRKRPAPFTAIATDRFKIDEVPLLRLQEAWLGHGDGAEHDAQPELRSVRILESVRTLGYQFAHGCPRLQELIVPSTVTEVGQYLACACVSLKTVRLEALIESLPTGAFAACYALETIRIPGSASVPRPKGQGPPYSPYSLPGSRWSAGCIRTCRNLRRVDFAASDILEFLGDGCFEGCTALEALHLPTSVRPYHRRSVRCWLLVPHGPSRWPEPSAGQREVPGQLLCNCFVRHAPFDRDGPGHCGRKHAARMRLLDARRPRQTDDALASFFIVGLKTIELPSSVREIKQGFAANCMALQEIVLCQDSCQEVLQVGFATGCTALRQFVIPPSVKELRGRPTSSTRTASMRTACSSPYYSSPTPPDGFLDGCESLLSIDIPVHRHS